MQRSKQSRWVVVGIIVVLVVAIGGLWGYRQYQQRNVDILSQMKLEYTGYDHHGVASVTEASAEKMQAAILDALDRQYKLTSDEKTALQATHNWDDATFMKVFANDTAKGMNVEKAYRAADLDFSKQDDLSNGDKITVTSKALQDLIHLKNGHKSFKVSGLKKPSTLSFANIMKQMTYKFYGYNHFGILQMWSKQYGDQSQTPLTFAVVKYGKPSNGDVIHLKLTDDQITQLESDKKVFKGSKTYAPGLFTSVFGT